LILINPQLIRVHLWLEIPAAFLMPAVTIELDRVAGAFTLCATVFTAGLRLAGTARILALVLIVRHGDPS
jgi:hypothetical protein